MDDVKATEHYSYDRTADTGPASRLKNVEPPIKAAEREIERSKAILHGLVKEMEFTVRHTKDKTIQDNFRQVEAFSSRLDAIDAEMDKFIADLEHFLRTFR